jgi:hypothetical protein
VARELRPSEAGIPVIPPPLLGTTFVYDPALGDYVPDHDRPGAPANGVRFILYAVNPITEEPIVGTEVGWADLLDESASVESGIALRLRVVSDGVTYLDYGITAEGGLTSATLGVSGFLTDGTTRLDFDIDVAYRLQGGRELLDVDFVFDVPGRGFHVEGSARGVEGGSGEVDMTIRFGPDRIALAAELSETTVDATVRVNGDLFATITGDREHPDIRGAGGRELTQRELEVLGRILWLVEQQFELLGCLLAPASGVLD